MHDNEAAAWVKSRASDSRLIVVDETTRKLRRHSQTPVANTPFNETL